MPEFATLLMAVAVGMLAWDCLEVGKNDAANLINGVFGARVMSHRSAVWLAGAAVGGPYFGRVEEVSGVGESAMSLIDFGSAGRVKLMHNHAPVSKL